MMPKNEQNQMEVKLSDASDEFYDLLDKLLAFEPEARLSACEALQHPFLS